MHALLPLLTREHVPSEEEIARYRRDGHLLLRSVLGEDEVSPFRPLMREAWEAHRLNRRPLAERDTYGRAFTQALNLGLTDPRLYGFAYAPRFARIAAALLGVSRVRMFLDEAFFKEPGSGPTPWHQDQPVWPFEGTEGVTLWVPLMDVTPAMGALTFASGSHREGALTDADISDESDAALHHIVHERGFDCVSYGALRAGDITAHHGFMVHSAGPNTTESTREVYAMHYFADGARVRATSPSHERILQHFAPMLREGDLAASERWRLVYPEAEPLVR